MAGGVNMLFGDMLNENQLYVGAVLNGELQDFGGQAAYVNRQSRYAWGGGLSHIPFRYGTYNQSIDSVNVSNQNYYFIKHTYNIYRIFRDQASIFSFYPFSKATRIEASSSFNYYHFRLDRYYAYSDEYYREIYPYNYNDNPERYRERNVKEGAITPFAYQDMNIAYVGDDASFGLASPMKGYRYRIELQQSLGRINMTSLLLDARTYFYVKPVTFAFKAFQYSRLGKDANNDLMPPLYLGYETLIRGYNYHALNSVDIEEANIVYNNLLGSKMALTNFEIRMPFTGPERLALIKSKFLFSDINLFFDAGIAWGEYSIFNNNTGFYDEYNRKLLDSKIITSAGITTRINVYGQIIIEPYYAIPLELKRGVYGLNFTPGW
jgi:hypothetical protein